MSDSLKDLVSALRMIDNHADEINDQQSILALARRVITDMPFRREIQRLETDRVGLAREILEIEQIRIDVTTPEGPNSPDDRSES